MQNKKGTAPFFSIFRMIDANLNRAKEGSRVCEDICRYLWNEKLLTRRYKDIRHAITEAVSALPSQKILAARSITTDVGRDSTLSELKREDIKSLFWANNQRVKESLRVLEEAAKLIDPAIAQHFKKIRYTLYAIETQALKRR